MNLFSLYAKIGLDTSEYEKKVKQSKTYSQSLEKELQNVSEEVKRLESSYKDSVSATGRYSDETKDLAEKLEQAKKKQADLASELENATGSAKKASISLSDIGSALKTGVTAAAGFATAVSTAVVGGLAAASAATEEYRVAQGKLNTAYEAAGYSTETAQQAYREFYEILGDTDRATEASQLLAKLAENEQDVSTWTNISAGVWGTFGDSLPIEGLVEATNETAKVGTVTGVLADALNWAGISEDAFNEQLAACSDESERNRLIMETLSATYDTAADAFYANNETIIQNRENQQLLTESLAKVGQAFDNVKNAVISYFSPAIREAGTNVSNFLNGINVEEAISGLKSLFDTFVTLSPAITGITAAVVAFRTAMTISAIIQGVTTAINAFKAANDAATISQAALNAVMNMNPFILIATLIAGVVAALITLWNTNEGFRNAVISIWNAVKEFISSAIKAIVGFFEDLVEFITSLPQKIKEIFDDIVQKALDLGKNIVDSIINGISAAWEGLKSWFNGLWDSLFGNRTANVTVNTTENRTVRTINGSHASGLSYVPFDGYIAELHKGEQVLTAKEADAYRSGRSGGVKVVQNIYSQAKTAADLMLEARHQQERAVLLGV